MLSLSSPPAGTPLAGTQTALVRAATAFVSITIDGDEPAFFGPKPLRKAAGLWMASEENGTLKFQDQSARECLLRTDFASISSTCGLRSKIAIRGWWLRRGGARPTSSALKSLPDSWSSGATS
jgi:hypothetical protein